MTLEQVIVIIIVAVPLTLSMLNKIRLDLAALIIAALLGIAQFAGLNVLGSEPSDAQRAIAGFAQPVVIVLMSLFVITRALDKVGVTRVLAGRLLGIAGDSEVRLIVVFCGIAALLPMIMNNVAAVALLLPSAIEATRRTGVRPSKVLMPIAFATLTGGAAFYFATANVITSGMLTQANPPQEALGIVDFLPTGGLMAIVALVYIGLLAGRLLPNREPLATQLVKRPTGSELEEVYQLGERICEARITRDSMLADRTLADARIGERLGVSVIAIQRGTTSIFAPSAFEMLQVDDVLLLTGRDDRVAQLRAEGLEIDCNGDGGPISQQGILLIEVLPVPYGEVVGRTLKDLDFRQQYGFTAVALLRDRPYRTDVADFTIRPGDSFLMAGPVDRLDELRAHPDFIVLEPDTSDKPIDKGDAALSVGIILAAAGAALLGAPVFLAMLAGAIVVLLTGLLSMEEAYRAIRWKVIFLVAGMFAMSTAMIETGLAQMIGTALLQVVEPLGPTGLIAGSFLLTSALTQIVGGQIAALVTAPISISAAIQSGVNPQAVAVATAHGCATAYLTPLAHAVNVMVMTPGNYRFSDFFRFGWGLWLAEFGAMLAAMSVFWPL